MKVPSTKDRFKLGIEGAGVNFTLAPLSSKQKGEVLASLSNRGGNQVQDRWEMVRLAVRYGVKACEGFEDSEGAALTLPLGDDGCLTDEGVDLVLNMGPEVAAVIQASLQFALSGKVDAVLNDDGKPVEGVTLAHAGKA